MAKIPVNGTAGTGSTQAPSQATGQPPRAGRFGIYKAEVREQVKLQMPSAPSSPFQQLNGLFLPIADNFFTLFERPLVHKPAHEVIEQVSAFNHRILNHMGFPEETHDFFSNWALTEAELSSTEDEQSLKLLAEAKELLDSAPDDAIHEKVSHYKEGKTIILTPRDKSSHNSFDKLWTFFEKLFTSPFTLLSDKIDQKEFALTLDILNQRVHGQLTRTVSAVEPATVIRPTNTS